MGTRAASSNRPWVITTLLVSLFLIPGAGSAAENAGTSGSIAGSVFVSGAATTPVSDLCLFAVTEVEGVEGVVAVAFSGAAGEFLLDPLAPGEYQIAYEDCVRDEPAYESGIDSTTYVVTAGVPITDVRLEVVQTGDVTSPLPQDPEDPGSGGGNPSDQDPGAVLTFDDSEGTTFEEDITWLASVGITRGCNPPDNTLFCPDDPVTRGQMAAFLHRALATQIVLQSTAPGVAPPVAGNPEYTPQWEILVQSPLVTNPEWFVPSAYCDFQTSLVGSAFWYFSNIPEGVWADNVTPGYFNDQVFSATKQTLYRYTASGWVFVAESDYYGSWASDFGGRGQYYKLTGGRWTPTTALGLDWETLAVRDAGYYGIYQVVWHTKGNGWWNPGRNGWVPTSGSWNYAGLYCHVQ